MGKMTKNTLMPIGLTIALLAGISPVVYSFGEAHARMNTLENRLESTRNELTYLRRTLSQNLSDLNERTARMEGKLNSIHQSFKKAQK